MDSVLTESFEARRRLGLAPEDATWALPQSVIVGGKAGLSQRDIAMLTGISFQRVAQLQAELRS